MQYPALLFMQRDGMGCCHQQFLIHLLRLGEVERQEVEAFVVQQLQLGGELLLLEAYDIAPCLDD